MRQRFFIFRDGTRCADYVDKGEPMARVRVTDFDLGKTEHVECYIRSDSDPIGTSWIEVSESQFIKEVAKHLPMPSKPEESSVFLQPICVDSNQFCGGSPQSPWGSLAPSGPASTTYQQALEEVKLRNQLAITNMRYLDVSNERDVHKKEVEHLTEQNTELRDMIDIVRTEYQETKNLLEIAQEKIRKLEKKTEKSYESCQL